MTVFEGAKLGVICGLAYCAIALLIVVATGGQVLEANSTTLAKLLAAYLIAGLLAGTLAGLLVSRIQNELGAAVVGFLVGLPAVFIVMMAVWPTQALMEPRSLAAIGITALLLGPGSAVYLWGKFK